MFDNTLIEAIGNGNLIEAKRLIERGAYVNAKDDDGQTALMRATGEGYTIRKDAGADETSPLTEYFLTILFICAGLVMLILPFYRKLTCKNKTTAEIIDIVSKKSPQSLACMMERSIPGWQAL